MSYENAWLNYQRNPESADKSYFAFVSTNGEGRVIKTAVTELKRAAKEILAADMKEVSELAAEGILLDLNPEAEVGEEGYHISEKDGRLTVESAGEKGILYGCFAVIRML